MNFGERLMKVKGMRTIGKFWNWEIGKLQIAFPKGSTKKDPAND
jgi:hypothetical protein